MYDPILVIKDFLRYHYTDERLCRLLAHAQDGKLAWYSCCCFVGLSHWDGEIHQLDETQSFSHDAYLTEEEAAIGMAYANLAGEDQDDDTDRRAILIPLILEEMDYRDSQRAIEQIQVAPQTAHDRNLLARVESDWDYE